MNKIRATLIATVLTLPTLATVNAATAPICKELTNAAGSNIVGFIDPVVCNTAPSIKQLVNSNQFPDVSYLGLCYVSRGAINVLWGTKELTVKTASAWIDSSSTFGVPVIFPPTNPASLYGVGYIGTVATQWAISDNEGKDLGVIYTRDTINLGENLATAGSEDDVVIGGSKLFEGAKGTIKLRSVQLQSGSVEVGTLGGKLCINSQEQNKN